MFIKLYLIALSIFIGIDMVWLGFLAKNFYAKQIGFLMKPNLNWLAVIFFYLLFVFGLVFFVIAPAMEKKSWLEIVLRGVLFGLIAYATYDLTNLATLKNWPWLVTLVDLLWGALISAFVSVTTILIARRLGL